MSQPGLRVSVGEPRVISRADGHHWFPTILFRLKDSSLLLGFSITPDEIPGNLAEGMPHALLKSMDDGHNWFLWSVWHGRLNEALPTAVLASGTLLGGISHVALLNPSGEPYLLEYQSHDSGNSWEGPREVPFLFPPGLIQPSSHPLPGRTLGELAVEGNLIEMPNGDWLRIADARFLGDAFWRVCLMKSADQGVSWSYASTIAGPESLARNFNESSLLRLPGGDLLCIMRTDLDGPNPMYQAKSSDGGVTWSKPAPVGVNGVRPQMVLMSHGVIACSYGRLSGSPSLGNQVMFSTDGGNSWGHHTTIYHGPSTGYTCLLERQPGELLLGYDMLGSGWTQRNSIMMVSIQVEKTRV